ncbi:MAG TPA: NAD-dependent epimerase/dehydratase family protein [Nannocystaceae bacterium]|nr:NAD-dependent epimerase/dehydratase family protein [Nannocystaceae bacterium]
MLSGRTRVLVTGADGFLGSHLVERLLADGHRVTALVRPSSITGTSTCRLRNLAHLREALAGVVAVDVAGSDAVDRMAEIEPEVVFHLAADAFVERSFTQPNEVLRTNLGGTMNALALARRCASVRRLVVTSSSEVYGPAQRPAIAEDHPLEPTSPYAASKLAADRMALAWHHTWGTPVTVVRPFNTYGPRHVYDVIPKFIALALRGEPIVVHGDGTQSRDFTWVDDMIEGFLLAASHPELVGRAIHFGSGTAVEIRALARAILEITGSRSPIVHGPERAAQVARLCCDASFAHGLGWRPSVELAEGLRRNVAWAREHG